MIVSIVIMAICFAIGISLVMLFPRFRNLNWGVWIALLAGLVIDRTAGELLRREYLAYDFRQSMDKALAEQGPSAFMPMDATERTALLDSLERIYRTQGKADALTAFQQRTDATVPVRLEQATNASREAWFEFASALTKALGQFDEAGAAERCLDWLRGKIDVQENERRRLGDSVTALDNLLRSHRKLEKNFPNESDAKEIEGLSLALMRKGNFSQDDFYLLKRLNGRLSADESRRLCHAVRLFYEELLQHDKNIVASFSQGIFVRP